jgi:hypothetical protein
MQIQMSTPSPMKKAFAPLSGLLVILVLCFLFFSGSPRPFGSFDLKSASDIASYFTFADGKITYVYSGAGSQNVGSYFQANGQWFIVTDKGYTNLLTPGWLSIQIEDPLTGTSTKLWRTLY